MKKYFIAMFAVIYTACAMSVVSCGSDDDDPEIDDKVAFSAVECLLAATPDLVEMCDIKVTYIDAYGERKNANINTTKVKHSFKTGAYAPGIDEWCLVSFSEQLSTLPSTVEFNVEFSPNGKKPTNVKPDLVVVRDLYGASYNIKGKKIKEGAIAFTEVGALGVQESGWTNMLKRFNYYVGSVAISVDKNGNFSYRD